MDLVKARKKAKKNGEDKDREKPVRAREAGERPAEKTAAASAPAAPPPEPKKKPAPPPAIKDEGPLEEFIDASFGEDLPTLDLDDTESIDDIILGHLGEKPPEPKLGPPPAKPAPKSAPKTPAPKPAPPKKQPLPPPPADEGWVVEAKKREDKSPALRDKPRIELDWEKDGEALTLSDIAPKDEDFFAIVTEDLYMREFGRAAEAEDTTHLALLSFRLAKEVYAVPLTSIKQIIKLTPVTMVPRVPGFVLGIISLRGTIIPIFDLRRVLRLTAAEPTRKSRIVIVASGKFTVGLIVDEVEQVVRFPEHQVEPPPPVLAGGEAEFIKGIVRLTGRMIILLALEKILTPVAAARTGV